MLNIIKKNQLIIFAIAFMLVTIGYLSYSMNVEHVAETSANELEQQAGIGDARLVSTNNTAIYDEEEASINNTDGNKVENELQEVANCQNNTTNENDNYFNQSRLDREKMYSESLESYQEILANQDIPQEQKSTAQEEINRINKQRNSIMIAENLIKNKGFQDLVIFVNDKSVSVIVKSDNLETADISQIQNIIQRELSVGVENIHISNK